MKTIKIIFGLIILVLVIVIGVAQGRISTGRYCNESPEVRWKFAIYTGECNDETGCHYDKTEGTGMLEYFALKPVDPKICH